MWLRVLEVRFSNPFTRNSKTCELTIHQIWLTTRVGSPFLSFKYEPNWQKCISDLKSSFSRVPPSTEQSDKSTRKSMRSAMAKIPPRWEGRISTVSLSGIHSNVRTWLMGLQDQADQMRVDSYNTISRS